MTNAPNSRLRYELDNHDKRIARLERFEPAVMLQRLQNLDDDVRELRNQIKWQTRALIGAMITLAGTLIVFLVAHPYGH